MKDPFATSNLLKINRGTILPNKLVKISDAASILGVSIDTLRRWEKIGKIRPVRTPGGTRLYSIEEISKINPNSVDSSYQTPSTQELLDKKAQGEFDWTKVPLARGDSEEGSRREAAANEMSEDARRDTELAGPRSKVNYLTPTLIILTIVLSTLSLSYISPMLSTLSPYLSKFPLFNQSEKEATLKIDPNVLAVSTIAREGKFLELNADTVITGNLAVEGEGIFKENLTAPNIVYNLTAGDNIAITGDPQTPTISATGIDEADTLLTVTTRGSTTTTGITIGDVFNMGNLSSEPSTAVNGATYYNTTSNVFRCYQNNAWKNCDTNTGSDGDITGVTAGDGLSGGGASGSVTLTVDATTTSTTTTTSANSGLEATSTGLRLLGGCSDTQTLAWDSGNAVWECSTGGGMTSFTLSGDSGTDQTISDANTLEIAGGTNGIDTVGTDTDTITLNLDTTEISDATFGSGSPFTWTFDTGSSDPILAFTSNQISIGSAVQGTITAFTVIDNPAITATSNQNFYKTLIDNSSAITITGATTSSIVASLAVDEPNITATGTVTNATTLYLIGAPTEGASGNFALWVDNGESRFENTPVSGSTSASALTVVPAYVVEAADLTLSGIKVAIDTNSNTDSGDTAYGLNLDDITTTAGPTEYAIRVGSGYDYPFYFELGTRDLRIAVTSPSAGTSPLTATVPALGADDTFCLATLANCTGGGGGSGVTFTSQTTNALTKFTSNSGEITSSGLTDDGSTFAFSANRAISLAAGTGSITQAYQPSGSTGTANAISTTSTFGIDATDQTLSGIFVDADTNSNTDSGDTLYGIQIDEITASSASEYGLAIGGGWDSNLYLNDTTTRVLLADGGTIVIHDGTNTLCTVTDSGTTGDLSCTGSITGGSSGTNGFWQRTSTTLSPATANDIVSIPTTNTTGADLAITNTGIYTGTGLVNITANSATTGDIFTISATALTSGSAFVYTGPSGGTAGVTDAAIKLTSDLGDITTPTVGLISSTATIDSTAASADGINLFLSTTNSNATNANTTYGIYNTMSDAVALGNTNYGMYNTITNTGVTSANKTVFGSYNIITNTGATGGTPFTYGARYQVYGDTGGSNSWAYGVNAEARNSDVLIGMSAIAARSIAGTSLNAYGIQASVDEEDGGSTIDTAYAGYFDTSTGGGTITTAYGVYIDDIAGTTDYGLYQSASSDDNYFAGNVGIGDSSPAEGKLTLVDTSNTVPAFYLANNTATTLGVGVNTTGVVDINSTSLTTGNLVNIETTTALSSGRVLNVSSTSTALTTGNLLRLEWVPGSATTATSGDLFQINLGSNGTLATGNLLNIIDSSSSIFSVSEAAFTTSLPSNFTSPGDLSVAYDIIFTNQTASYIKSSGPLYLEAGESFESNDLTLTLYNAGSVIIDGSTDVNTGTTGVFDINVNSLTTSNIGFNLDYTSDSGVTAAADLFAGVINLQQNDADGDLFGLLINNNSTSVTIAGTNLVECLLCLENDENQAASVADAIRISSTASTAGAITNGINISTTDVTNDIVLQNSEVIHNNTDAFIYFTDGTNTLFTIEDGGTLGYIGIGTDTDPDNLLDIQSSDTTQDMVTITASSLTTAAALSLVGPTSTGVISGTSSGFAEIASDVGSGGTAGVLLYLAPDFSAGSATSGYGTYINGTDSTAIGNTDYNLYSTLALTGNAAKTGYGIYSTVTSNSTTADTLYAGYFAPSASGAISADTRTIVGVSSQPNLTGANTGGTTAIYGVLSQVASTGSTTGSIVSIADVYAGGATTTLTTDGTLIRYGVIIGNNTMDTTGATSQYGIFLNAMTGADINYGLCFDCDGTWTTSTTAAGIQFGTDANAVTLFRNGNDMLYTEDQLTILVDADLASAVDAICGDTDLEGDMAVDSISIIADCSGSPTSDYAEMYPTVLDIEYGDIVSTGDELVNVKKVEDTKFIEGEYYQISRLVKSSTPYDTKVIGITSNNYGDFSSTGHNVIDAEDHPLPVALNGRVPVKVSLENGEIEPGDFLTSSSTPGVAMKATRPGQVIGKALESFDGSFCHPELVSGSQIGPESSSGRQFCFNKIITFVNITFADPTQALANLILDEEGNLVIPKIKTDSLEIGTISNPSSIELTSKLKVVDEAIATQSAQIAEQQSAIDSLREQINSVIASDPASLNRHSGLDPESQTEEILNQVEFASLHSQDDEKNALDLTPPEILLATGSATLAELKITETLSSEKLFTALDATVSGTLKALSDTFLGTTTIAGDLTVDGTFSITGSSINVIGSPTCHPEQSEGYISFANAQDDSDCGILYIQNSPLASLVDFFNGSVTIDKDGLIKTEAVLASEYQVVEGQTSGSGTLAAGTFEVPIFNGRITENSRVFITLTSSTSLNPYVSEKIPGAGFVVSTLTPAAEDITFDWWMINEVAEATQ